MSTVTKLILLSKDIVIKPVVTNNLRFATCAQINQTSQQLEQVLQDLELLRCFFLKCQNYSTALDIWSAGIIFLCFLSAQYPFFKCKDDMSAIMQIVTIFGSQRCIEAAKLLGKEFCCLPPQPSQSLAAVCQKLRYVRLRKGENKPVSLF